MKSQSKKNSVIVLGLSLAVYLSLALGGIRYGLPDQGHFFSYNCDELNYIEVLSHMNPAKLQLNPYPFFTHPTGYLFANAAALFAAQAVGWIPKGDKEFFRVNPELFARFYLVGRFLQVLCGVGLLLLLWFIAAKIFNEDTAAWAVLLFSICPALVAGSHFSQASMPVAFLTFIALFFLLMGADRGYERRALFAAALFNGIAIGTKLSALAFLAPLVFYVFKTEKKLKTGLIAFLLIGIGFFIATPFSLLAPKSFYKALFFHVTANQLPIPGIWEGLTFCLRVSFPNSLGWPLWLLCAAGVLYAAFGKKTPAMTVLLVWTAGFYAGTVRIGLIATPPRLVIVLPTLILLAAHMIDELGKRGRLFKPAIMTVALIVYSLTSFYAFAILALRLTTPQQKKISYWIVENIPIEKSIGVPWLTYWWTPDTVLQSVHKPERLAKARPIRELRCSKENLEKEKPDFILLSERDRTACGFDFPAETCNDYFNRIESSPNYRLIKEFPRNVGFGGWTWNRPERMFQSDDDLWVTGMKIYKRTDTPL